MLFFYERKALGVVVVLLLFAAAVLAFQFLFRLSLPQQLHRHVTFLFSRKREEISFYSLFDLLFVFAAHSKVEFDVRESFSLRQFVMKQSFFLYFIAFITLKPIIRYIL